MRASLPTSVVMTLVVLLACGGADDAAPVSPEPPPGKVDAPGFSVSGDREWHLIGNPLTSGDDLYDLTIQAPAGTQFVDLWIDGQHAGRSFPSGGGFAFEVNISSLGPGDYEVLINADNEPFAFAVRPLRRSHPLYVVVTNDWDDPDNTDANLARQDQLHQNHPDLILTHFVGPYTFTDPSVSPARRSELVDMLRTYESDEGDEIGLHIHPYCSFVEYAGLSCKTAPSFRRASDASGYTVRLGAYTEGEFSQLLETADELFAAHGLPKPTSFRAGGWTLEAHTLRALAGNGFVADTSAANWSRLEEWEGVPEATLFEWNRQQWASIDELSQPYYPNRTDLLSDAEPTVSVLEVPDNGLLCDYVTADEMIDMFQANWSGAALPEPRQYSIGYHPTSFSQAYFERLDGALDHIDQHLAKNDAGPVIYARLSGMPRVWSR